MVFRNFNDPCHQAEKASTTAESMGYTSNEKSTYVVGRPYMDVFPGVAQQYQILLKNKKKNNGFGGKLRFIRPARKAARQKTILQRPQIAPALLDSTACFNVIKSSVILPGHKHCQQALRSRTNCFGSPSLQRHKPPTRLMLL